MASTDAKSGFRLPWSADRNDSDEQAAAPAEAGEPTEATGAAVEQAGEAGQALTEEDVPVPSDAEPQPPVAEGLAETAVEERTADTSDPSPAGTTSSAPPARKPNKFMADLTKAMQTAAEAARADTLERFSAEAKSHIEGIHASTADEATELRKKADDDIAAIREWSKAEIARIREETDERIAHRKDVLEREIEAHAAQIEARIERVQAHVNSFEAEMAAFFDRLLAEEDPTRFAAMAETLPEPPPFDAAVATSTTEWATDSWSTDAAPAVNAESDAGVADAVAEPVAEPVTEPVAEPAEAWSAGAADGVEGPVAVQAPVDDAAPPVAEVSGWDPEQTLSTADDTMATSESVEPAETVHDAGDLFSIGADEATTNGIDPRLSALGIEGDYAAAEAEAGALPTEESSDEQEIPTIAEDALAARLAGLVAEESAPASEAASTRVIVTGLVSVASIAGFKRNLARVGGVRSVGVSSGPDGEFVFAVTHDPGLDLSDGIATLPGFGARVTNEAPGELTVAARDPESEG